MRKILYNGILCLLLCLAFSCSQNKQPEPATALEAGKTKTRNNKNTTALSVSSQNFINGFYNNASYTVGRQEQTQDGAANYLVSEIIVTGNARGYLVTDQANGAPLFFADVDRTNYSMTSVDIVANQTENMSNINQNPEYSLTNGYDFIGIVSEYNNNPEGRPFWGWGGFEPFSFSPCGPHPDKSGRMVKLGLIGYYIFGIRIKRELDFGPC